MAKKKMLPKVGDWKGNSEARSLKLGGGQKAILDYTNDIDAQGSYGLSSDEFGDAFNGMTIGQLRKLGAGLIAMADAVEGVAAGAE